MVNVLRRGLQFKPELKNRQELIFLKGAGMFKKLFGEGRKAFTLTSFALGISGAFMGAAGFIHRRFEIELIPFYEEKLLAYRAFVDWVGAKVYGLILFPLDISIPDWLPEIAALSISIAIVNYRSQKVAFDLEGSENKGSPDFRIYMRENVSERLKHPLRIFTFVQLIFSALINYLIWWVFAKLWYRVGRPHWLVGFPAWAGSTAATIVRGLLLVSLVRIVIRPLIILFPAGLSQRDVRRLKVQFVVTIVILFSAALAVFGFYEANRLV